MSGKRIGYIRVSTYEQNPDRQLVDVKLDKKFIDYASAASKDRPQLKLMLEFVREDDIVIVHSMDRLARNLVDLRQLVDDIISKGAEIHFHKEQLTFNKSSNPMSNLLLSLMGALAEFELAFIKERIREGVDQAKKNGKYKGRKRKLTEDHVKQILEKYKNSRKPITEVAKEFGVSRGTIYKRFQQENIKVKDLK